MAKLVTSDVANISGAETAALATLNENFTAIETAMENTLSRDGTAPNTMNTDFDMNDNDILNVGAIDVTSLSIGGTAVAATELLALGYNGWSPVFAIASDGTARVLQLVSWVGGEGTAPTDYINYYVGASGMVVAIGDGVDIRGPGGVGTGDMLASNNLSDVASASTSFTNIKQAASTTATGVVELATDAETQTGTDTSRAITPANLTAKEATTADVRANTADRILTTDVVNSAMAVVTLTDAATVAWDMSTGIDFQVTLGGNRTLGDPTNTIVGRRGRIKVIQDGTGSRTLTKSSNHKTAGGAAISLTTTASAIDYIDYDCVSSTEIRLSVSKGWS
jgi:hypothetical protein